MASADDAIKTIQDVEKRLASVEKLLYGNGAVGVKERFAKLWSELYGDKDTNSTGYQQRLKDMESSVQEVRTELDTLNQTLFGDSKLREEGIKTKLAGVETFVREVKLSLRFSKAIATFFGATTLTGILALIAIVKGLI